MLDGIDAISDPKPGAVALVVQNDTVKLAFVYYESGNVTHHKESKRTGEEIKAALGCPYVLIGCLK